MLKVFPIMTALSMVLITAPTATADPAQGPGSPAGSSSASLDPNQPLCFMETTSGQIVDLTAICGSTSVAQQNQPVVSSTSSSTASGSAAFISPTANSATAGSATSMSAGSRPNQPCYFLDSDGRPCTAQ